MPELKTTDLYITETVLDTAAEQSLELDFLLPDYEPEVFRVLTTRVAPAVQQLRASGGRLEVTGVCAVSVLYLGADPHTLHAVRQSVPFTKSIDLPADGEVQARCIPRCYHVSARAVSGRRLEVRCGLSLRLRAARQVPRPVLCGEGGGGVQLHSRPFPACGKRGYAEKSCTLSEDLSIGDAKPSFGSLLDAAARVQVAESKLTSGKLIVRGDLITRVLYCPEAGGPPEPMEWSEPISQILDLPDAADDSLLTVHACPVTMSFEPVRAEGGCRTLSAEWTVRFTAFCDRNGTVEAADDGYSCACEAEPAFETFPVQKAAAALSETVPAAGLIPASGVDSLLALLPSIGEYACQQEDGKLVLSGALELTAIFSRGGEIDAASKTVLFAYPLPAGTEGAQLFPTLDIQSYSGRITDGGIEAQASLLLTGTLYETKAVKLLTGLALGEPGKRTGAALRLIYAQPGESLWEIAKRAKTPLPAILQENGLEGDRVSERQMLLIPMVSD